MDNSSSAPTKPEILMRCEAVALQFAAALQNKESKGSPAQTEIVSAGSDVGNTNDTVKTDMNQMTTDVKGLPASTHPVFIDPNYQFMVPQGFYDPTRNQVHQYPILPSIQLQSTAPYYQPLEMYNVQKQQAIPNGANGRGKRRGRGRSMSAAHTNMEAKFDEHPVITTRGRGKRAGKFLGWNTQQKQQANINPSYGLADGTILAPNNAYQSNMHTYDTSIYNAMSETPLSPHSPDSRIFAQPTSEEQNQNGQQNDPSTCDSSNSPQLPVFDPNNTSYLIKNIDQFSMLHPMYNQNEVLQIYTIQDQDSYNQYIQSQGQIPSNQLPGYISMSYPVNTSNPGSSNQLPTLEQQMLAQQQHIQQQAVPLPPPIETARVPDQVQPISTPVKSKASKGKRQQNDDNFQHAPHSEKMVSVTVRNTDTNDIRTYQSLRGAAEALGINPGTLCRALQQKNGQPVRSSIIGKFEVSRTFPPPVQSPNNHASSSPNLTSVENGSQGELDTQDLANEQSQSSPLLQYRASGRRKSARRIQQQKQALQQYQQQPIQVETYIPPPPPPPVQRKGRQGRQKKAAPAPLELPMYYTGERQVSISQSPMEILLRDNPFREQDQIKADGILEALRQKKLRKEALLNKEYVTYTENNAPEPYRIINRQLPVHFHHNLATYNESKNIRMRLPQGDITSKQDRFDTKLNTPFEYMPLDFHSDASHMRPKGEDISTLHKKDLSEHIATVAPNVIQKDCGELISMLENKVYQRMNDATRNENEMHYEEFKRATLSVLSANAFISGDCETFISSLTKIVVDEVEKRILSKINSHQKLETGIQTEDLQTSQFPKLNIKQYEYNDFKDAASPHNQTLISVAQATNNTMNDNIINNVVYPNTISTNLFSLTSPSLITGPSPTLEFAANSPSVSSESQLQSPIMGASFNIDPNNHSHDFDSANADDKRRKRGRPNTGFHKNKRSNSGA